MGYRHQITIAVYDKDYENIKNLCSARLFALAQVYESEEIKADKEMMALITPKLKEKANL